MEAVHVGWNLTLPLVRMDSGVRKMTNAQAAPVRQALTEIVPQQVISAMPGRAMMLWTNALPSRWLMVPLVMTVFSAQLVTSARVVSVFQAVVIPARHRLSATSQPIPV